VQAYRNLISYATNGEVLTPDCGGFQGCNGLHKPLTLVHPSFT
jgi:hypothetical protein